MTVFEIPLFASRYDDSLGSISNLYSFPKLKFLNSMDLLTVALEIPSLRKRHQFLHNVEFGNHWRFAHL